MAPHVKTKRQTLRNKYKVMRKVRQHHREVRRANRNKPEVRKIRSKDPGIPNLWPFKQQMMEAIERKKVEDTETRKALQAARREAFQKARESGMDSSLANVVADAKMREMQYEHRRKGQNENAADDDDEADNGEDDIMSKDGSKRAFMKEFRKVVEGSDVILEVLDARDPLGCRCYEAEKSIMASSGGKKRIVLVLNKVDLVPKEVTDKWLAYLRNDFPTIAFRASLQEGRSKGQASMSALAASSVNTSECLGANSLLSILKNYARNRNLKTNIAVGIIGYPNVGKSSIINSLKRWRAVNSGANPGVTRVAQEVQLDKNIRLIDCPGIVFSQSQADALVLRNCIKLDQLYDPITPVETILKRVGPEPLMVAYGVPRFNSTAEFLACVCSSRGKLKVGGVFDMNSAARLVLKDWNSGNIPFYTLPPKGPSKAHVGASVVQEWGKDFDINAVVDDEKAMLNQLDTMSAKEKARFTSISVSDNAEAENESNGDSMDDDIDEDDDDEEDDEEDEDDGNNPTFHVAGSSSKNGMSDDDEIQAGPSA